jgi:hypothetical protein
MKMAMPGASWTAVVAATAFPTSPLPNCRMNLVECVKKMGTCSAALEGGTCRAKARRYISRTSEPNVP